MNVRVLCAAILTAAFAFAAPSAALTQSAAAAQPTVDRRAFARSLEDFAARLAASPNAPPGFVVVAVHGGDTVFEKAYGTRDLKTGAPMTLDTPVYNASVTKAYTGLLAAMLDAEGVLPLDSTLKDVWPQITLRDGLDPSKVTIRQLLSHVSGLGDDGLVFRTVVTGEFDSAMVPGHLAAHAAPVDPGFRYDNLGPFIYSAMVEHRTGEPWREAVARRVFRPLGLKRTTARLEDFPARDVAHCNVRSDGWSSAPHKPTPVLNAAGGMYASGRDTAAFLKAFITDGRSAGGAIPAAILRKTWEKTSTQDRRFWGFHRDGYGLGWDLGTYEGRRFVSRSGAFTGCRAIALFLPEEGFSVTVLTAGDAGANTFNALIVKQAIDLWTGHADAPARSRDRVAEFDKALAGPAERLKAAADRLRNPIATEPAALRALAGIYDNASAGRLVLETYRDRLMLTSGIWTGDVKSLGPDDFRVVQRGVATGDPFKVERDPSGAVVAVTWEDLRYARVRP